MTLAPNRIFDCEDVFALDAPRFVIRARAMRIFPVWTNGIATLAGLRGNKPSIALSDDVRGRCTFQPARRSGVHVAHSLVITNSRYQTAIDLSIANGIYGQ